MSAAVGHQSGALSDLARAVRLAPRLKRPRAALVKFLVPSVKRDSMHEQIEALLQARQSLISAGIDAATAGAILGEVERALAV